MFLEGDVIMELTNHDLFESLIEVIAEKGKMVILPQKKTLDDMLAMVTSENIHSEISTGSSVGNEEW